MVRTPWGFYASIFVIFVDMISNMDYTVGRSGDRDWSDCSEAVQSADVFGNFGLIIQFKSNRLPRGTLARFSRHKLVLPRAT